MDTKQNLQIQCGDGPLLYTAVSLFLSSLGVGSRLQIKSDLTSLDLNVLCVCRKKTP